MGARRLAVIVFASALAFPLVVVGPDGASALQDPDPHRPQLHFAPERNWVNDPNGPIWYDGEYHLFFQYNPEGDLWGNMSWGHAVSPDLVHWEELPVAIPYGEEEHIFSGTVVVDEENTSGFGRPGSPAMVAVYTSWYPATGVQAQSLAYSTDRGRTWTKYAGNPVLDLASREFRDPKVFWYEDGGYWVMAVVLATERRLQLYRSDDLRSWTHMSDFGPANAVGGVWEMPDLFELPVDGDPDRTKWVLVMNLNPGSIAGGSGAQYFIGDFDGTRFTADDVVTGRPPPSGDVFADFEEDGWAPGWTVTGTAFGDRPATGALPGQQGVSGYAGSALVNSFVDGDRSQGTLTSPPFTIRRDYVNLLVGGGNHPWQPGAGDGAPPSGVLVADFESTGFGDWSVTGDAFGSGPAAGDAPCQAGVTGFLGERLANSFHDGDPALCDTAPDGGTGSLTSPDITITHDYLSFLVGGGPHDDTAVRLLVDGVPVRSASGAESGALNWASWDLRDLAGRTARIEILDANAGGWGHVMADHFVLSDEPAQPRSTETAVNLVVDGETVRTATGRNSEVLDWASWDVHDLVGRTAKIEVVDRNSGGWGHVLTDRIMFADEPVLSELQHYDWLDFGKDFYAALTVEDHPDDRRVAIAWMSNWEYAAVTPTEGWRGAMSLPRELALRTVDGELRLTQRPVAAMAALHGAGRTYRLRDRTVDDRVLMLPTRAHGTTLEIAAVFDPGDAEEFGLHVRSGVGERTVIGYDARREELFVDRRASGDVDFHPAFGGVHAGPLVPGPDGQVRMKVYVDRSSVEVFGGRGETVVTDLVYPRLSSRGIAVYAEGGDVTVRSLRVRPLRPATG